MPHMPRRLCLSDPGSSLHGGRRPEEDPGWWVLWWMLLHRTLKGRGETLLLVLSLNELPSCRSVQEAGWLGGGWATRALAAVSCSALTASTTSSARCRLLVCEARPLATS